MARDLDNVDTISVLAASIAHEVNQPLSGILTNASTCLRMLSADPPNIEVALGPAIIAWTFHAQGVYWIGPGIGGAAAGLVWKLFLLPEKG